MTIVLTQDSHFDSVNLIEIFPPQTIPHFVLRLRRPPRGPRRPISINTRDHSMAIITLYR